MHDHRCGPRFLSFRLGVARSAYRHYEDPPTYGDKHIGFRVASQFVFRGTEVAEVVASRPNARAYRVERGPAGEAIEMALPTRYLG